MPLFIYINQSRVGRRLLMLYDVIYSLITLSKVLLILSENPFNYKQLLLLLRASIPKMANYPNISRLLVKFIVNYLQ